MICAGGTYAGATKRTVTELDVPVLVRTLCITSCSYQILVPFTVSLACRVCWKKRDSSALVLLWSFLHRIEQR